MVPIDNLPEKRIGNSPVLVTRMFSIITGSRLRAAVDCTVTLPSDLASEPSRRIQVLSRFAPAQQYSLQPPHSVRDKWRARVRGSRRSKGVGRTEFVASDSVFVEKLDLFSRNVDSTCGP